MSSRLAQTRRVSPRGGDIEEEESTVRTLGGGWRAVIAVTWCAATTRAVKRWHTPLVLAHLRRRPSQRGSRGTAAAPVLLPTCVVVALVRCGAVVGRLASGARTAYG